MMAIQPFTCAGRRLERGDLLDGDSISPDLLRMLIEQRYVVPASRSDAEGALPALLGVAPARRS